MLIKKTVKYIIFLIGWVLSPFTWWNDSFVNIPLSYILANALYFIIPIPFGWIVIAAYWFTNILGLFIMWSSGKSIIISAKDKARATIFMVVFLFVYTIIMMFLHTKGYVLPITEYFKKHHNQIMGIK